MLDISISLSLNVTFTTTFYDSTLYYVVCIVLTGVTMTLFCTHGRVSGPNSLLDHEVIAPCGYSVPCQF